MFDRRSWSVASCAALVMVSLAFTACDGDALVDLEAVIDGPDQARIGTLVRLDGSQSQSPSGTALEYMWRLVELPPASKAVLDDARIVSPVFLADASGDYVVELVVSAGVHASRATSHAITVSTCGEAAPQVTALNAAPNEPPVGRSVVLSAQVEDADNEAGCDAGQTFTYAWRLGSAPAPSTANIMRADLPEAWLVPDVAGDYVIEVVVTDSTGLGSEARSVMVVASDSDVEASASATPEQGVAPLTVDFRCEVNGDAPRAYAWSFGNGAVSTLQHPTFSYTDPGRFTATCVARDVDGDESAASIEITVDADSAPMVQVSADPRAGVAPLQVNLTALVSGGNGELAYAWDFGDGKVASTATVPAHAFAAAGVYPVVLTVTDADGDVGSDLIEIAVGTDDVPAVAVSAVPQSGVSPLDVQFEAFPGGGNGPLTFEWDFGDGDSSRLPHPPHTFETVANQDFTAMVTVTDEDGDTASDTVVVSVQGDVTVASTSAGATPSSGRVPMLVGFTCDAVGGNAPLAYAWTFGDGASSSEQNPFHSYATADAYTATCVVTDANGDVDADNVNVTAQPNHEPSVLLAADVTRGVEPLTVTFQATPSGGDGSLALDWNFGDGTTKPGGSATEQRVYGVGTYQVGVIVTDADGDAARATLVITVDAEGAPLEVGAIAEPSQGIGAADAPMLVTFSAQVAGGNAPFTYLWNFDNSALSPSTLASPTAAFVPGVYAVSLQVTDADGDSAMAQVQVSVEADQAAVIDEVTATEAPPPAGDPNQVSFTCTVLTGNPPFAFEWTFGDGEGSTQQNPFHTYPGGAGIFAAYTATCTVTDADGDIDSKSLDLVIAP